MKRSTTLALLTGQTVAFTVAGAGLWIATGRPFETFLTFGLDEILMGVGLAAGLIALALAIFNGLPKLGESLVRDQAGNFAFLLKDKLPFWAIVWLSLGAGIGEEALFRGGLQTIAGDYFGPAVAVIISAAVFAFIHYSTVRVGLMIFIGGLVFGVAYWWTGSLLTVMVGHALYDVFALWYVQKEMHRLDVFADLEPEEAD